MGWAGVALQLVGGIMGAQGQMQAGKDAQKAEEYNAGVLRANAQATQISSDYDIHRQKKVKEGFRSAQVAGYSKAGVRLEGSPLLAMIESSAAQDLDISIAKYNAQNQISQLNNEADQRIKMGKAAVKSGNAAATSTLLSTAGSAANSYSRLKTGVR